MIRKLFVVFIFCIFAQSTCAADKQNSELNNLFAQLKSLSNSQEAKKVEDKIWELWTTHPSEDTLTELLAKGSEYMMQNQLTSAHNVFSKVIELDPKWAEGWNKSLEKRHFGALSGQGLVQTALENYEKAIDSYIEAHKIYPSSQSTLQMIEQLSILLQKESI